MKVTTHGVKVKVTQNLLSLTRHKLVFSKHRLCYCNKIKKFCSVKQIKSLMRVFFLQQGYCKCAIVATVL